MPTQEQIQSPDFQQQLKDAQAASTVIGETREKMLRDAAVAENQVKTARERLAALGVKDADKLSASDLTALRDKTQAELQANLASVQTKITEANTVMAEYEEATRD